MTHLERQPIAVTLAPALAGLCWALFPAISGNHLTPPPGRLNRSIYANVVKFARGKWNTKAQAHVFAEDPTKKLGPLLTDRKIVEEQKLRYVFPYSFGNPIPR